MMKNHWRTSQRLLKSNSRNNKLLPHQKLKSRERCQD
jgi:hypothetical protein